MSFARTTRLQCLSESAAAAVLAEAHREGDTEHNVWQEGDVVVIGFFDARYPLDVADWASRNGHACDADAARVIGGL